MYSDKQIETLFDEICDRIAKGESLSAILRNNDMPSRPLFYKWIKDNDEKINKYARATEIRSELIFDEMLDIADDGLNDFTKKQIDEGIEVEVLNSEHIQRSRLRIDTRKWILSKMNPKKYGDKIEVDNKLSGSLSIDLTPTERESRIAELKAKLNAD